MPLVEIEDTNALIDNKPFFDQPVNNKQEAYERLIKMSKNDNYIRGNLINQNYCKLISKDLSRKTNTSIPQQINFTGKLEENDGAIMFFIAEKQQKKFLNFSLNSLIVT